MNFNKKRWDEETVHAGRIYTNWDNHKLYNCNAVWIDKDGKGCAEMMDLETGNTIEVTDIQFWSMEDPYEMCLHWSRILEEYD